MNRRLRITALLAVLLALGATACGGDDSSAASANRAAGPDEAGSPTVNGDITVFAAASLTESFTEIGEAFETANPDAGVTFSFASSSALVQQINEGAPADIYASADEANMTRLTGASNARGEPARFATNRLAIITGPGNPKRIERVEDLADPDLIFVTCGPQVPIGRYTEQVFQTAGVNVTPRSYEADVKGIVTKVTLGEADAGIVYATDVAAASDKAAGVSIPDDLNVVASYPIAVTKASKNVDVAKAFIAFVMSNEGQDILAAHGFSEP